MVLTSLVLDEYRAWLMTKLHSSLSRQNNKIIYEAYAKCTVHNQCKIIVQMQRVQLIHSVPPGHLFFLFFNTLPKMMRGEVNKPGKGEKDTDAGTQRQRTSIATLSKKLGTTAFTPAHKRLVCIT